MTVLAVAGYALALLYLALLRQSQHLLDRAWQREDGYAELLEKAIKFRTCGKKPAPNGGASDND